VLGYFIEKAHMLRTWNSNRQKRFQLLPLLDLLFCESGKVNVNLIDLLKGVVDN